MMVDQFYTNIPESSWIILLYLGITFYILTLIFFLPKNRINQAGLTLPACLKEETPKSREINVAQVSIPFTFKILEKPALTNDGTTEIECSVSSEGPFRIETYWGVNIKKLFKTLHQPLVGELLLKDCCQKLGPSFAGNSRADYEGLKLLVPNLDLGSPPRACYPLVILLTKSSSRGDGNEILALINVIHVKDEACEAPTRIFAQYFKHADGELSSLEQLYVACGNSGEFDENRDGNVRQFCDSERKTHQFRKGAEKYNGGGEQLCVVCQYKSLSRAILPCKHTCVCKNCFVQLKRCPMCRKFIEGYFRIRDEDEDEDFYSI